ncbi:MAG: inositol monophosphatase family protein, partial [Dermabacter sp.]|nr:inositol monophosphatase family protein [Dermabacter sp.]
MASAHQDDIRLAHVLADSVDQLTMSRFKSEDLTRERKDDDSIVTDADRAAEELIRAQLSRTRSRDQVIGEEFGSHGESNRKWIIDPIDGTANFARGVPVWA